MLPACILLDVRDDQALLARDQRAMARAVVDIKADGAGDLCVQDVRPTRIAACGARYQVRLAFQQENRGAVIEDELTQVVQQALQDFVQVKRSRQGPAGCQERLGDLARAPLGSAQTGGVPRKRFRTPLGHG